MENLKWNKGEERKAEEEMAQVYRRRISLAINS